MVIDQLNPFYTPNKKHVVIDQLNPFYTPNKKLRSEKMDNNLPVTKYPQFYLSEIIIDAIIRRWNGGTS